MLDGCLIALRCTMDEHTVIDNEVYPDNYFADPLPNGTAGRLDQICFPIRFIKRTSLVTLPAQNHWKGFGRSCKPTVHFNLTIFTPTMTNENRFNEKPLLTITETTNTQSCRNPPSDVYLVSLKKSLNRWRHMLFQTYSGGQVLHFTFQSFMEFTYSFNRN